MHAVIWVALTIQSASESWFPMEQVQNYVAWLKSSEVYLPIEIEYMGVIARGVLEKWIEKCYVLQEFSASVGLWLSEQSSLTCVHILGVLQQAFSWILWIFQTLLDNHHIKL